MTTPASLAHFRYLITDMDGVLWRGASRCPELGDFFSFLRGMTSALCAPPTTPQRCREDWLSVCRAGAAEFQPERDRDFVHGPRDIWRPSAARRRGLYVIGMEGLRVALEQKGFVLAEEDVAASSWASTGTSRTSFQARGAQYRGRGEGSSAATAIALFESRRDWCLQWRTAGADPKRRPM